MKPLVHTADLVLGPCPPGSTRTQWLYQAIRTAILEGRLRRGAVLPATRTLAREYSVSRRLVVDAFDLLRDEGYLTAVVGSGTRVSDNIPEDFLAGRTESPRKAASLLRPVEPRSSAVPRMRERPFVPVLPSLSDFPMQLWAKLEARSLRRVSTRDLADCDTAGDWTLRSAIAAHLGASRGVVCSPAQVVITSGTQQSLDLLARLTLQAGDRVWIEDPGYTGAAEIFRLARARVVPIPVDSDGMRLPGATRRRVAPPRAVYLTPAHQFPLGMALRLDRRLQLFRWAKEHQVLIYEDDYDSEFRFSGRPIPALMGLGDGATQVFLMGTFNKALFPTLRIGYIVAPEAWIDPLLHLCRLTQRFAPVLPQRTLAAFLTEGHFARHLRRLREIYGTRLAALRQAVHRTLAGALTLAEIEAGLSVPAFLDPSIGGSAREVAERAKSSQIELWSLDRFAFERNDLNGFLLGFAPFTERQLQAAVVALGRLVENPRV